MTPFPVIEKLSLVAPLGVCFHDAATGERVNDGLKVSVYPANGGAWKKRIFAFPNRVGVYVLHKAPGLTDFSNGAGDARFWQENPPQKFFVVEVFDTERRFQPFQFTAQLPVRGIYKWENIPPLSPPNKSASSIPLYSAPTRKALGGMSVVRAHLRRSNDVPASWAVLEARFGGNLVARGFADRDGQIVLIFPALAPESDPFITPSDSIITPPTTATRISLAEQKWILDLTVKYEPNIFPSAPPSLADDGEEIFPDLRLVLAQATGKLWADAGQTEEYETATLHLGKELILRSRAEQNLSPTADASVVNSSFLFVSPA
jgi:hypothetical protein